MKSKTIQEDLIKLYEENDQLRNMDDMAIYWFYLIKKIDEDLKAKGLLRIDYFAALKRVFLDASFRKKKGIASFRSVVRCRAKIQNTYKMFIPDEKTQEGRDNKEAEYRKFATGYNADIG